MGEKITLQLDNRTVRGKKVARLRREAILPGVVYGSIKADKPYNVQIARGEFEKAYRVAGKHSPVHLRVNGKPGIAMIRDVDWDPVKNLPLHVSFYVVKSNEPVEAEVPIRLTGEGESEAERAGLVVLQTLETVEVRALPLELPESLEISIKDLKEAGERIVVRDLELPNGVEIVDNDDGRIDNEDEQRTTILDLVVASVYEPSALQAANEEAGGDAEDEAEVEAENGGDTDQTSQDTEDMPGGKAQDEPKQSNVDSKQ